MISLQSAQAHLVVCPSLSNIGRVATAVSHVLSQEAEEQFQLARVILNFVISNQGWRSAEIRRAWPRAHSRWRRRWLPGRRRRRGGRHCLWVVWDGGCLCTSLQCSRENQKLLLDS